MNAPEWAEQTGTEVTICTECGTRNPADEQFCLGCGDFLDWSDRTERSGPAPSTSEPRRQERPPERADTRAVPVGLSASVPPDLTRAVEAARTRVEHTPVRVVLAGEFDTGKSSLVNALLQTAVCPQDADEVTVVPTLVRFGESAGATLHHFVEGSAPQQVSLDSVADHVSMQGNPRNRRRLSSVEITVPHRLLRTGLQLLDTPGVGGVDSGYGAVTLGALAGAQGLLFVTDAAAELSEPELEFLRDAVARIPAAACVVTKIDLYPHWRTIADRDRGHLRAAGLDLPVFGVSSFVRQLARTSPELAQESGFPALAEFLARVVEDARSTAAATAAGDVRFAAAQLGREIAVEATVLREPAAARRVVPALAADVQSTTRLRSPTATWQQALTDGGQDLVADIEHGLDRRLRTVQHEVEEFIDQVDPKDAWVDIENRMRRQAGRAAVATYDEIARRAEDLAVSVADAFRLEAPGPVELPGPDPQHALGGLSMSGPGPRSGGRLGSMLFATRMAMFVPMALFGAAVSLVGVAVAAPVSVALAVGIGGELLRQDRKRSLAARRAQAKSATHRFLFDEVRPVMAKQTRDALRVTQRRLRDEFGARAAALHESSARAMQAAERAAMLPGPARADRAAELDRQAAELRRLDRRLETGQWQR